MVTRVPSTLIREEEIDLASVPWSLETGRNLLTQARRISIFPLQLHEPRWQRNNLNARDRDSGIKKYGFGSCGRAGILRDDWCVPVLSVPPRLDEQLPLVDTPTWTMSTTWQISSAQRTCRTSDPNSHARRFGRQRPRLIWRILRRLTYLRGSPANQRCLVRSLRRRPGALAVSASEGTNILRTLPLILGTLQENEPAILAVLDRVEDVTIPSRAAS